MAGLLNYTTGVDADRTIGQISSMLVRFGANRISTGFGPDRRPDSIEFEVDTPFGLRAFRLPARVEAIEATLKKQVRARKIQPRFASREQAERVGWRIVKDWLETQLAIVESQMVTFDEVFLPYMVQGTETMHQFLLRKHKALEGPREG